MASPHPRGRDQGRWFGGDPLRHLQEGASDQTSTEATTKGPMTGDRKIRELKTIAGESVKNPETGDLEIHISPASDTAEAKALPDAQTDVTVSAQELQDLGDFLQAIRVIVLGQEERISYIEAFLQAATSGEDTDEVEGNGLPEEPGTGAEEVPGAEDASDPTDPADEIGDELPEQA